MMEVPKSWLILTSTLWTIELLYLAATSEAMFTQSKVDLCQTMNCTCVNTTTRKTIHCSFKWKGALPTSISVPLEVTEIDLSRCSIPAIRAETFEGTYISVNLVKLDLSNNDIVSVEDNSFEMFEGLRQLNLRRNRIANITIAMFHRLRQLEHLDLSYNNIQNVDMDVLLPCISLCEFNLRYSGVNLQGLQDLLMSATSMLETLDLHGLGLEKLPTEIFLETSYIKKLILSGNGLREVPGAALSRLKFIKVLDLSDNLILELNAVDFDNMDSLEELYLNELNQLVYIDDGAFHSLKHLKILSCSYNPRLETIHPGAFKGISEGLTNSSKWSLQEVIIRQNALTTLAQELLPWEKIRYLDLNENPWNCDCRLRWMKFVQWSLQKKSQLHCAAPRTLRSRPIDEIPFQSFSCDEGVDTHLAASIALLLSTLLVVSVGCCVFACWKLNWFNKCRATFQRRYHRLKTPPFPMDYQCRDQIMTTIRQVEVQIPSDDTK